MWVRVRCGLPHHESSDIKECICLLHVSRLVRLYWGTVRVTDPLHNSGMRVQRHWRQTVRFGRGTLASGDGVTAGTRAGYGSPHPPPRPRPVQPYRVTSIRTRGTPKCKLRELILKKRQQISSAKFLWISISKFLRK
jgi:hypothetical protein